MLSRIPLPSVEYLQQCYQFDGGTLYWRERPRSHYKLASRYQAHLKLVGTPVRLKCNFGYSRVKLNGKYIFVHRIVWKMHHGTEPNHIDHIDGDRSNNRIVNLRECTQSQNFFNAARPKNNTSGYKGVTRRKGCAHWSAFIGDNGRARLIGNYQTKEEAADAYFAEAQRVAGEFARRG